MLSGLVDARVTILSSEIGGSVTGVFVSEGEEVDAGELVATIDDSLLRLELEAAKARRDVVLATLEMIESGPRTVDLAVAEANRAYARAVKDGAIRSLEEAQLSNPVALRDERVAVAQASVDQAEANLKIAESNLDELLSGSPESRIASAKAAISSSEAEVARLQAMIERQSLASPINGVVLDIYQLPGERALPGQAIVSVTDIAEVEVKVFVPEFDLNWVNLGEIVEVKFDAFPDRSYVGVVIHISDRAEFTPRNIQTPEERVILVYPVKVRIANPGGDLKPGLTVDVIFGGES
jgi:HlyD family secretion protein